MTADILKPIPPEVMRSNGQTDGICSGVAAVGQRLYELQALHLKRNGISLLVPPDLRTAWQRYNSLAARIKRGDLRYKDSELKALKEIAQFSVDMVRILRGQDPVEVDL